MYREVMKVDYSSKKQRHVGVVEKRHLRFEDGTHIYQTPNSGRGLGTRNENPVATPRAVMEEKAAESQPQTAKVGLKLTTTTTTKPDVNVV